MATAERLEARGHDPGDVFNQPPPLKQEDLFGDDRALVEAVAREDGDWAAPRLHQLGRLAASDEAIAWGIQANAHPPVLRTHDRFGHRIDEVEFHPAWHRLLEVAVEHAVHALPWRERRPRRAFPVSCSPESCPTGRSTGFTSSGSRTSWATAPTLRARSSSRAPGRGWWVSRAAGSGPSWRWSTTPASTAWSARRRECARRWCRQSTMRPTAGHSAAC